MESLIKELSGMSAFLPGTLEEYYSVCGKKGCACADKKKPKKHGPYYRLSYDIRGRNSCLFVKKADVEKIREMTAAHKRAKDIISELSIANLELVLKEGVCGAQEIFFTVPKLDESKNAVVKPETSGLDKSDKGRKRWRERSMKYQGQLENRRVEARDLCTSREKWREEALSLRKKLAALEDRLASAEKEKFVLEVELKKKLR